MQANPDKFRILQLIRQLRIELQFLPPQQEECCQRLDLELRKAQFMFSDLRLVRGSNDGPDAA